MSGTTPAGFDVPGVSATQSSYASVLESVAPGICAIVDTARRTGETWFDALENTLMSVSATDEQRALLMRLAAMARAELAAPDFDVLVNGEPVTPVNWGKLAAIAGVLLAVRGLLK